MTTRIEKRFAQLRAQNRAGFVAFVTAGDPTFETSLAITQGLPAAGADIIELGMPFSDPIADGPAIQDSSQRALKAGATMDRTLELVTRFRKKDQDTPIVLMGYYNPIYHRGVERFLREATAAGVDGLIIVDLPPEADDELCLPATAAGINFIRLATPTTDDKRLPAVLANTSGFLYYVSITGVTGTRAAALDSVKAAVTRFRAATPLPVAIGFGLRTPEQAREVAKIADAAVVGSALVDAAATGATAGDAVTPTLSLARALADAVHSARNA